GDLRERHGNAGRRRHATEQRPRHIDWLLGRCQPPWLHADQPPVTLDDDVAEHLLTCEAEALRGVSGAFQDEPLRNASGTNESRRDRTAMADAGPTGRRPTGTGSGGRLIVTAIRDRGLR